jgi:fucose permease
MTAPGSAYARERVTWAAFGALFAFGLLNALLGPSLPYLRATLHLSYVVAGLHQAAFAVGGGTAGLLATSGRSPLRRRTTVAAGLALAGLAGLAIGYGGSAAVTLTGALLVSFFATSALIAVWATLSDVHAGHRAVALTEGEVSVSVAGVVTPVIVGSLAATALGWSSAFVLVALVALVAAAVGAGTGMPGATPAPAPVDGARPSGRRATLATIFAVVALEFSLSFWLATYLADDVGFARDAAATTVSLLYAAHLAGRLAASRVARRVEPQRLLLAALAVVLVGVPFLLAATGTVTVVVGIVVAGMGTGATFPLASSLHVQASARSADAALGETLTVAAVGQVVGPLLAGGLAQVTSLRVGLLVLPVCCVLAAASVWQQRSGGPTRA